MDWIYEIASESVLSQAYTRLCERRRDCSTNDDARDLRWRWDQLRPRLQDWLRAGVYRIGAVRRFPVGDETVEVWSALDALVLKATALVLTAHWLPNLSPHCYDIEGRGGPKAAVRFVNEHLADNTFVFRTDVKSYYASIDEGILLALLEEDVRDERVLDLLQRYVRRTIYAGGLYEDVKRGISLGCPLSPFEGSPLPEASGRTRMEASGLAYARFMDDWATLAPTRWKFRAAIRLVNETLAELKFQQHTDETFIGRVCRGLTSWAISLLSRGWRSPRARSSVVLNVCPGFMSEVRTRSASEHTFGDGSAGPGAASGRVRANLIASAMKIAWAVHSVSASGHWRPSLRWCLLLANRAWTANDAGAPIAKSQMVAGSGTEEAPT
jgi:RNA-directed DNA polymerase